MMESTTLENKPSYKKTERMVLVITIGIIAGLLISYGLKGRLFANIGVSTPESLFWRSPGPIGLNDFVVFELRHPILDHPATVVKKVRCAPGQHLVVTDQKAVCDGLFLGLKKKYTLKGDPMPVFVYDGIIPEGKVFVMNNHKDSFDSRYYGLRDIDEMTRVKPIF